MSAPRIGKKARSPEARTRRALRKKERRKQLRGADGKKEPEIILSHSYLKEIREKYGDGT